MISRRLLLSGLAATPVAAQDVDLRLGLAGRRPLADPFAGKRGMIVQRSLPPLLETPLGVFHEGLITSTERFFVRWHYPFPTDVDMDSYRLRLVGHVARPQALSLAVLARLPQHETIAINQCAGNGRGLADPRVPGAQWANGAMGNAVWRGPLLRDVLARAGVRAGAMTLRATGLDVPTMDGAPPFAKSLALDHALGNDVMLATHMNGALLPIVHGAPVRLVVPGWYSTYWVKALDRIEILAAADDSYWMAKAYRIPDTPDGSVAPGSAGFATRAVAAMVPRSFITNIAAGSRVPWQERLAVSGIAMGGDTGVAAVSVSADGGRHWAAATLGLDGGKHGFRQFSADLAVARGEAVLVARATNSRGETQPLVAGWNPGGFQRSVVEPVPVVIV